MRTYVILWVSEEAQEHATCPRCIVLQLGRVFRSQHSAERHEMPAAYSKSIKVIQRMMPPLTVRYGSTKSPSTATPELSRGTEMSATIAPRVSTKSLALTPSLNNGCPAPIHTKAGLRPRTASDSITGIGVTPPKTLTPLCGNPERDKPTCALCVGRGARSNVGGSEKA